VPVALVLLAAFMLASVGGRYSWPSVPALFAASALFLVSGARLGSDAATRGLNVILAACLGFIAFQLTPLPSRLLNTISPATSHLYDAYALLDAGAWRPLSIDPAATRAGLILALTAALVFWAAREAFSHGGSRAATRLLAIIGLACGFISLSQHATAPGTVLWHWTVADPRATPFGPFVDRNQLATWLVLAISVVAGSLMMHVARRRRENWRRGIRAAIVLLGDGLGVILSGCLIVMLLTLVATLSRSGLIALLAAVVIGTSLSRRDHRRTAWTGVAAAAALVVLAVWVNAEGFAQRVMTSIAAAPPEAVGRLTIWRDTLRVIRDFPVFGTGIGTFAEAMFVYQQSARQVLFNHAHNEYLQIAAEGGLLLLTFVVAGVMVLAWAARRALAEDTSTYRYVRIGACAGLTAIAVQSVWETGLRAPANLVLAAILAGMALANRVQPDSETFVV
jgi:O-antigen ligase